VVFINLADAMKENIDIFKIRTNNIPPKKGRVLIAEPFLYGDYFSRSVVIMVAYSKKGTVGFILNKKIDFSIQKVFPEFPDFEANVYLGGPVAPDSLFFIHKYGNLLPGSIHVLGNIFWGGDFDVLKTLIADKQIKPGDIHFYLGYSGWDAGQLEDELKENSWLVTDIEEDLIMKDANQFSWNEFVRKAGNRYSIWENFPENPNFN